MPLASFAGGFYLWDRNLEGMVNDYRHGPLRERTIHECMSIDVSAAECHENGALGNVARVIDERSGDRAGIANQPATGNGACQVPKRPHESPRC